VKTTNVQCDNVKRISYCVSSCFLFTCVFLVTAMHALVLCVACGSENVIQYKRSINHMKTSLAYCQAFTENLLESENFVCIVLRSGRIPSRVSSSFGSITSQHLLSRHLAMTCTFPWRLKRDAPVVAGAFTPVSLANGEDHRSLPIFQRPPRTPGHLTHTRQPKNSVSVQDFYHFRSVFYHNLQSFQTSVF